MHVEIKPLASATIGLSLALDTGLQNLAQSLGLIPFKRTANAAQPALRTSVPCAFSTPHS